MGSHFGSGQVELGPVPEIVKRVFVFSQQQGTPEAGKINFFVSKLPGERQDSVSQFFTRSRSVGGGVEMKALEAFRPNLRHFLWPSRVVDVFPPHAR